LEERGSREYVSPLGAWLVHLGLRDRDALCSSFEAYQADGATGFTLEVMGGPFLDEFGTDPRIAEYISQLHMVPR
jgi:hypothetical protein